MVNGDRYFAVKSIFMNGVDDFFSYIIERLDLLAAIARLRPAYFHEGCGEAELNAL